MLYSLRWRLLLSFVVISAVALGMGALFVSRAANAEIERTQDRTETQRSERLKTLLVRQYTQSQGWQGVQIMLEQVGQLYDDRVVVVDRTGLVVADSRGSLVGRFVVGTVDSDRTLSVIGPVGNVGTMLVNPKPLPGDSAIVTPEKNLPSINRFLIYGGLVAGGVAIVLTFFLSRRILAPVESLSRAAGALASGDFSRRVPVQSRDEVGALAQTFNTMAEELARTEEIRRSLVADVAHELRTPVSNIRGYLEAIQDGLVKTDHGTLDSMHEEVLILTRFIEDLQELALADSGQLHLDIQPCDMSDLVRRAVTALQNRAEAKGIEVDADVPGPAPIQADPERIGQILRNLLANAANYTPAGGSIRVGVVRTEDGTVVNVEDTGKGISQEELPYVFERFYRVDKSRSRATGGVGLGLTNAKRLVEAHGGNITVRSWLGAGTTFTLPDAGQESQIT